MIPEKVKRIAKRLDIHLYTPTNSTANMICILSSTETHIGKSKQSLQHNLSTNDVFCEEEDYDEIISQY